MLRYAALPNPRGIWNSSLGKPKVRSLNGQEEVSEGESSRSALFKQEQSFESEKYSLLASQDPSALECISAPIPHPTPPPEQKHFFF